MKPLLLIHLLLFSLWSIGQDSPIQWKVNAQKKNDQTYLLQFSATIKKGWYVYAVNDTATKTDGIELIINDDNTNISKTYFNEKTISIHDVVFGKTMAVLKNDLSNNQDLAVKDNTAFVTVTLQGYASDGSNFLPIQETRKVPLPGIIANAPANEIKISNIHLSSPSSTCGNDGSVADKNLLSIFLLGLGGGLIALLTPCVFPMLPVTVSFFTKKASSKRQGINNGLLYGFFIFLIYGLISIPFHLLGHINPNLFNEIATNAWVNIFFFIVFIVFALSLFGVFELRLPSFIANKADHKSNVTSKGGIFFMALTLAIVSFSCTGPILGSLLVGSLSSTGGAWQLSAGLAGFGFGLAVPFVIFAIFPQLLNALPKSGGWMERLKKVLAFIELAMALKFLSNADLVAHWGFLKREVFIAAWAIIALLCGLYLLNVFERKKYHLYIVGKNKEVFPIQKFFGILALLFSIYLIPGITKTGSRQLSLLTGFAPPINYSIYNNTINNLQPDVINDYQKALQLARQERKPLLIDFTGWACVNCRKMEEQVWTNPTVAALIRNKFILLSLYVDDAKNLPAANQFMYKASNGEEREVKTFGDKWALFQSENFGQVSQPLYALLNTDEKLMNHPIGYTPGQQQYAAWLRCGLEAFESLK